MMQTQNAGRPPKQHLTRSWSRRMAVAAMAVAAITGLTACSSSSPATSSSSQSSAKSSAQHMAAGDFATAVDKPGTIVLDVRTPAEYASGRLPKAQNINLESPDFATRIGSLDKSATYAVYCKSGRRSNAAMEQMTAAGFTHVYDLTGGIGAWQTMGGPMIMDEPMAPGDPMMSHTP